MSFAFCRAGSLLQCFLLFPTFLRLCVLTFKVFLLLFWQTLEDPEITIAEAELSGAQVLVNYVGGG